MITDVSLLYEKFLQRCCYSGRPANLVSWLIYRRRSCYDAGEADSVSLPHFAPFWAQIWGVPSYYALIEKIDIYDGNYPQNAFDFE